MINKKINSKGFAGLLVLLIATAIIAIISYKALIQQGDNPVGLNEAKKQIDKAKEIADFAEQRAKQIESQIDDSGLLRKENLEVVFKVDNGKEAKKYLKVAENGITVIDLMKKLDEDESDFSFEYKDSQLGAFVEKINSTGNDAKANMYWMFYVNGKLAQVGASDYKIADGDIIEWRYEDTSNAF